LHWITLDGNRIVGDTIKTFGNSVEKERDTIKSSFFMISEAAVVAPDATLIGANWGAFYNGVPVFSV
jgi:hypothetical protein